MGYDIFGARRRRDQVASCGLILGGLWRTSGAGSGRDQVASCNLSLFWNMLEDIGGTTREGQLTQTCYACAVQI